MAHPNGPMEIVFSFDTTGSMYGYLEEVRGRVSDMIQRLQADIPGIKIAIFAHGDYCDRGSTYVTKYIDFTDDVTKTRFVNAYSKDDTVNINKEEFRMLMNKMKTFETIVREQQDTIEELKTSTQNQQIQNADQAEKLNELTNMCERKSDMKRQTHNDMVRRQSDNTVVAFSATLNQRNVEHIGVHQNIVFSDVITNIGGGYNNHHGLFIAPVAGLYMFMTTILSGQNVEYVAAIEINGSDVVRMFERGTDNRHGSATQTVIVQLKKGDDVAVQSLSADHTYWGDKYSTFSGVLLQEFETGQIIG